MDDISSLLSFFNFFSPIDYLRMAFDVGVVSYIFYRFLLLIRGTRAVQLIKGLVVLVVAYFAGRLLGLVTFTWLLDQLRLVILVALPIVFQPELRRALEHLGRGRFFARPITFLDVEDTSAMIDELVRAATGLAKKKTGALMVIERRSGLQEFLETGVKLDALVSTELIVNLFYPGTPLHDGAVIIRGNRVLAAACFLPLSDSPYLSKQLGSRHRAALGVSEVSDAVVLIVSEETGAISVAEAGRLTRYLGDQELHQLLTELLLPGQDVEERHLWRRRS